MATSVKKKDIDWTSLGFAYTQCDYSFVAHYQDGAWDEGGLTTNPSITLSECANIFHYCQEVFEGLRPIPQLLVTLFVSALILMLSVW